MSICTLDSVFAVASCMMKAGYAPSLPSTGIRTPNFSFSFQVMVRASVAVSSAVRLIAMRPSSSREPQRFSDWTTSAEVTGLPSSHLRPGLSVKV